MTNERFVVDELLVDSAENLFASTCGFDAVQAAEEAGWADDVWNAVAEAGFAWIGVDDAVGGSGGSLLDAAEVLRIAGANAAPIPLAETGILGGWLLGTAGIALPDGPVTVVPGFSQDTLSAVATGDTIELSGTAHRVPWASRSDLIVAIVSTAGGSEDGDSQYVVAVEPSAVQIDPSVNVAGEPRDTVVFDGVTVAAERSAAVTDPTLAEQFRLRGTLSRVMLMAGALEAMSALTVAYTEERTQFGKPIGRFQAVQQHLVWGAQDAAIAKMAAKVAAGHATTGVVDATFQITSARTIADECASTATRWAHQAHGAMGMTQEYALHHLSRRLWAWRHEFASPGEWAGSVGRAAEAAGADGLYPLIAS
jgi:acyl-CoA dehydrogenase